MIGGVYDVDAQHIRMEARGAVSDIMNLKLQNIDLSPAIIIWHTLTLLHPPQLLRTALVGGTPCHFPGVMNTTAMGTLVRSTAHDTLAFCTKRIVNVPPTGNTHIVDDNRASTDAETLPSNFTAIFSKTHIISQAGLGVKGHIAHGIKIGSLFDTLTNACADHSHLDRVLSWTRGIAGMPCRTASIYAKVDIAHLVLPGILYKFRAGSRAVIVTIGMIAD
mmetsp:Transcript_12698/g.27581  ORF Transcript_12698/g.27581 Transcript_12698/m.27581 type:complete len:220 (-) Transcript_12698:1881-2540(-)